MPLQAIVVKLFITDLVNTVGLFTILLPQNHVAAQTTVSVKCQRLNVTVILAVMVIIVTIQVDTVLIAEIHLEGS